jgi:hypothetical protein
MFPQLAAGIFIERLIGTIRRERIFRSPVILE